MNIRTTSTNASGTRDTFYSRDLEMLSESAVATSSPQIDYDYVWFAGRPTAQVNSNVSNAGTYWTFDDVLGTISPWTVDG